VEVGLAARLDFFVLLKQDLAVESVSMAQPDVILLLCLFGLEAAQLLALVVFCPHKGYTSILFLLNKTLTMCLCIPIIGKVTLGIGDIGDVRC
jgi:hypothetical protein